MHLAAPLPVWLAILVAAGILGVAALAYRRPLAPLSRRASITLAVLRALALAALVVLLARPSLLVPPGRSGDVVVPVLVDISRSMRVPDGGEGRTRLEEAARILTADVLPALSGRFKPDILTFGERVGSAAPDTLTADARHSDLSTAVETVVDRYRGRAVAGIVVLTDGAETGQKPRDERQTLPVPVFALGVGSPDGPPDLEVIGLSAGDPKLDAATVDLKVTAISRGLSRAPFELRVLLDGRVIESRRVTPAADASPVDAEFTVAPDPAAASVYTAEIAPVSGEAIVENNRRSVLVSPPGRKRRILAVQGSPGYDHSFMARALAADSSLELDTVVRKGKNDAGQETFFVQAGGGRATMLATGFPGTRESLFVYDALIVANVESDFFTKDQLQLMADFVSERGGGLLVFGGRSFAQRGLTNTPLEEVIPVELGDRRGALVRAAFDPDRVPKHHTVTLTADGLSHPVTRIGARAEDSEKLWNAMPPLSSAAQLGGPRSGAQILAVTATGGGAVVPLIAVQRYGRGRAMVFAGEGSWRWRMMRAHTDRSHELFWRQSARWLSTSAPEPVSLVLPESSEPGDPVTISVDAFDAAFTAVPEAEVSATLIGPGSEPIPLTLKRESDRGARFSTTFRADRPGLYRVQATARRKGTELGSDDRWFFVGGADREFADLRLNEGVLRRLTATSGGRYAPAREAGGLRDWLTQAPSPQGEPERKDLWHEPWVFGALVLLLFTEWMLRRRWGLR